jgi:pimeloyl-ACP methyl ester carboxylesterase
MRTRFLVFIASIIVLALVYPAHLAHAQSGAASSNSSTLQFDLPLDNGRLQLRDVLLKICDELGIQPTQSIQKADWSIDVTTTVGKLQLNVLDKLADGAFTTSVNGDRVTVVIDKAVIKQKVASAGHTVAYWFGDLTGRVNRAEPTVFGLSVVTDANPRTPVANVAELPKHMIVLVHGLDDPGFMWRDLIPTLRTAGLTVARFEYRNDGAIGEAADSFAATLADLRTRGVESVDVVAHSMGGLVTRDVLTRPAFYNGDGTGGQQFPAIDRFIMLGTPNHGSQMVRLRGLAELREHVYRAFNGDVSSFTSDADGDGEAAIDLMPDSDFLRRLNSRALPTHTRMSIIAAKWSPLDGSSVKSLADRLRKLADSSSAPQWVRDMVSESSADSAASLLTQAVDGLGDGCVTIQSTRLEGVDDFTLVKGSHMSMIVNTMGADGVPPAIPIILERLTVSTAERAP